jgi:hypothetical protein
MSEQAQAVTESTGQDAMVGGQAEGIQGDTPDQRAQALKAELVAQERAELGEEAPGMADTPPPAAGDPVAARRERLAALVAKEQEVTRARQAREAARQPKGVMLTEENVLQLRERLERAEALEQRMSSLSSPEALLAYAEEHNIAPEDFAKAIRAGLENPELAILRKANLKAKEAADPVMQELRALKAELERERAEARETRAQAEERQLHEQAARQFTQFTESNADSAPYVANLMSKNPDAFVSYANEIANTLPPGSGYQAVLDKMEENLHGFASLLGSPVQSGQKSPSRKIAPGGITNRQAAERASVPVDDDAFRAKLASLETAEERAAFLKDFYRRTER